jgi:tetraacyldisaccharide 4'-kinase
MLDLLRILLLPFVPIYSAVISIRNFLFDKGILKSRKVDAAVISIGNLTVGGSGKTPLVIAVLKLLKAEGKRAGVLSRGYGRTTKGYLLVSDGENMKSSVAEAGDEIYLTALECKVPAAAAEKRVEGAERFIADTKVDTIVLDDAFQHRWIKRDVDMLVFEQRFLTGGSPLRRMMLPTGNRRESFRSSGRADIIVINRKFSQKKTIPEKYKRYLPEEIMFDAYYKVVGFTDIKTGKTYDIEEFRGQKSLLVSGIAMPYSFFNAVSQLSVDTTNKLIFRDHKSYTESDVKNIRKQFYATNAYSVITTRKDAVKLMEFSVELDDIDVYMLDIEMKFDAEEKVKEFLIKKIN